jgi:hypothetical protein
VNRCHRIVMILLLAGACGGDANEERPAPAPGTSASASQATATPSRTVADFQGLRYLEGDWRGSGYAGGPFYESYRFADDTTIEMTAWADSTMVVPRERSRYMLRDGVIRADRGGVLVSVDADGHHFRRGSSAWTFRSVSPDRWTARVGPSTTYTMDRIVRR